MESALLTNDFDSISEYKKPLLLGAKIRQLRVERKMVQRELAEQQDRVGCTPCKTVASGATGETASCEREGTAHPLACR